MKINEIYIFLLKLTKYVKYAFSIFKLTIILFGFLAWSARKSRVFRTKQNHIMQLLQLLSPILITINGLQSIYDFQIIYQLTHR